MPSLVMRAPADSLIEQTNRLIVRRQIEYGAALRRPGASRSRPSTPATWSSPTSIPTSACPGSGLKRGLADNAVIAPYATALATMVDPQAAARNFERLRGHRRARPLRLLRGARLHAGPSPGRRARRRRAGLHGPPPGHDDRRHRRHPAGRPDARALPRRADRPGDGAAAAGARAARRHDGRRRRWRRRCRRPGSARSKQPGLAHGQPVERHAGHPAALQRPLYR